MNNLNVNDSVNFVKGNIKNGADCYFKLLLKFLKDCIASLENQLHDKQYIAEELLRKSFKSPCNRICQQ